MKNMLILALTVSAMALAGCGTKPSSPETTGHAKTYPDVNTDPVPRGGHAVILPPQ